MVRSAADLLDGQEMMLDNVHQHQAVLNRGLLAGNYAYLP